MKTARKLVLAALAVLVFSTGAQAQDNQNIAFSPESAFQRFVDKSQKELDEAGVFLDEILLGFSVLKYGINEEPYRREISRLATALQLKLKELDDAKAKKPAEGAPTFEERVRLVYKYLFSDENFKYRENYSDVALFSLNKVLDKDNREGNSLGLGLLVLAVLERLSDNPVSLSGAWTGDHFVLMYATSLREDRYLEPDEQGLDRSSKSYDIPPAAVQSGAYLTALSKEEIVGFVSYAYAKVLYEEKNFKSAEKFLNFAVKRAPKLAEAHMLLAAILLGKMEEEAYKKARIELDTVCKLNPNCARAYLLRGIAHYNLGERAEAVDDFRKVQLLNPKDEESYYYLGRIYDDEGDKAAARKMFETFISKASKERESLRVEARYFVREIDASEPIKVLRNPEAAYAEKIEALKVLKRLKVSGSVSHIIEALSDDNVRFRYLCAEALAEITKQDFGVDQDKWRLWWNTKKPGEYR
jgi:tetratricopeptide (TPR) repeat protein